MYVLSVTLYNQLDSVDVECDKDINCFTFINLFLLELILICSRVVKKLGTGSQSIEKFLYKIKV